MYKVLVCDDEKDIVSAISIYLTSDGYEVIPARNGTGGARYSKTQ